MLNMIKADLYRIFKGKGLYAALIVLIVIAAFSLFAMSPGHIGLAQATNDNNTETITNKEIKKKLMETESLIETRKIIKASASFELDKKIIGTNVNLYYFFIVIVALVLTADFSNSTIKNTLSSAISRKKYYLSKFITCIGLGTILILINNYGIYIGNILLNGSNFSSSFIDITKLTLIQLPMLYGIISLLLCISFGTKKMAVYNGISIPFIIVCQMILLGLNSIFQSGMGDTMKYEFQYAMSGLAMNPSNTYILNCLLIGIGYIIIFNFIGYNIFKKTEIK